MKGCGDCTACCTLFPIEPIGKPMNTHCQYCESECSIYGNKPQMCTDFECAYLQADNVPEGLRPDKCGVIFTKKTDNMFSGTLIPEVGITDAAKGQIQSFNDQGYSVVLLSLKEKKPLLVLAAGHDAEVVMAEYKEAISGYK